MATVSVLNMEGKEVEKLELNDNIFGVEINEHLVHLAVVSQLANNRQGTQKAKTRSDRKEQVMQDRDLSVLHSGKAEELYLLQHQESTQRN